MNDQQLIDLAIEAYQKWCASHRYFEVEFVRAHTRVLPLYHYGWRRVIIADNMGRAVAMYDYRNDGRMHRIDPPPHIPKVVHVVKPSKPRPHIFADRVGQLGWNLAEVAP